MWFFEKKKKQKDIFDLLTNALEEADQKIQTVGKPLFDKQRPDRDDFGHSATNPIFTSSFSGTEDYLGRLCTKTGAKFTWSSHTPIRATVGGYEDVGEDVYTLYLDGEKYTKLYIIHYVGESKFPPAGMYFCDDDTDWDLEREAFGKGRTGVQLVEMRKFKEELENERRKTKTEQEQAIIQKAECINSKYADVSIETELQNPEFVFLASCDIDILTVYEYCHREELRFKNVSKQSHNVEDLNTGLYFNIMRDIEIAEIQKENRKNEKTNAELQKEAAAKGVRIDQLIELQAIKKDNAEFKWKLRVEKLRTLAKQAIEVQSNYPEFNLSAEWKKTSFRTITDRLGMLAAYEIAHFNECYTLTQNIETVPHQEDERSIQLFCRKCGTRLVTDSDFCHRCGAEVVIQ